MVVDHYGAKKLCVITYLKPEEGGVNIGEIVTKVLRQDSTVVQ